MATSKSRMRLSASRTASSNPSRPFGGSGIHSRDVVIGDDDFVAQRLDQRARDRVRHRRDESDPVTRQGGREERRLDDEAPGEMSHGGVPLHHLLVREDLGAADVEGAVDVGRQLRAADEVPQHIPDRDWLDPRRQPLRCDHRRETLGEIAQHLEGRRAGAEDHRRFQDDRRHAGREQDLPDLGPRLQVRREVAALGVQAPEVDQPAQLGIAGRGRKRRCGLPIGLGEPMSGAQRVNQVVRDVDAVERLADIVRIPSRRLPRSRRRAPTARRAALRVSET